MLHLCYEILMALAAIATVAEFILDAWKEYKRQRMTKGERGLRTPANALSPIANTCVARPVSISGLRRHLHFTTKHLLNQSLLVFKFNFSTMIQVFYFEFFHHLLIEQKLFTSTNQEPSAPSSSSVQGS